MDDDPLDGVPQGPLTPEEERIARLLIHRVGAKGVITLAELIQKLDWWARAYRGTKFFLQIFLSIVAGWLVFKEQIRDLIGLP